MALTLAVDREIAGALRAPRPVRARLDADATAPRLSRAAAGLGAAADGGSATRWRSVTTPRPDIRRSTRCASELHYPTDSDNRRTYEAVAAMWRANLGAQVETYNEEFRVQLNERHLKKLALFHYAWIGDYPDPYTFLQLFQTGFGYNDGGYSNPRYDALLDRGRQRSRRGAALQLLAQAEAMLNEDVACIPLYYYATRHLIKPYVRGWTSNIQDRNLSQYMYLLEHQGH